MKLKKLLPTDFLKNFFKKDIIAKWLVIGLFLRLLIMPITFHPDIAYLNVESHFFSYHGVLNIYEYKQQTGQCYGFDNECYTYIVIPYYFFGFFQKNFAPILPFFHDWMNQSIAIILKHGTGLDFIKSANGWIYAYLFVLKLPYLFFDLGIAFLLLKYFDEKKFGVFAFKFWMLNPVLLLSTFAMGQFDVIAAFFAVFGLFLAKKGKKFEGILLIGIAIATKLYPIIIFPIAILFLGKSILEKIKLAIAGLIPLAISILPFIQANILQSVFFSWSIRKSASLSYAFFGIPLFFMAYSLVILAAFTPRGQKTFENFALAGLLSFFAFSFFHPQYFLITTPLFAIFLAKNRNTMPAYALLLVSYFVITASLGPELTLGLLMPLNLSFARMPGYWEFFGNNSAIILIMAKALFSTTCGYFALKAIDFKFKPLFHSFRE